MIDDAQHRRQQTRLPERAEASVDVVFADASVDVVFAKASRLHEAFGEAAELRPRGAVLHFGQADVVEGLRELRPRSGDMVTIRFLDRPQIVSGRIVEADLETDPAVIEVEYAPLLSLGLAGTARSFPTSPARVELLAAPSGPETLELVGHRLAQCFELIEGLRSLSNLAATTPDRTPHSYAAPPTLKRLSVASPASIVVDMAPQIYNLLPLGAAAAYLAVVGTLVAYRKRWYEGTAQKRANRLAELDIRMKELAIEEESAARELRREILERIRRDFPDSVVSDQEAVEQIDEYVLGPLRSLGRDGVREVQIHHE